VYHRLDKKTRQPWEIEAISFRRCLELAGEHGLVSEGVQEPSLRGFDIETFVELRDGSWLALEPYYDYVTYYHIRKGYDDTPTR